MNLFEFLRLQGVDISRYLPKFLHDDNKSIKDVLDACSWEHEKQRKALIDIAKQFFVETATWGLSDWERIVEVKPGPADTYEQRRNRILLKLNGTRTSTVQFMEELARRYVSEDSEVSVEEIPEEYLFILRLMKGSILYSQDLVDAIRTYIPAHLGWILQLEREIKFDDNDTIRYGLANLVDGQVRLGLENPPDAVLQYLAEAVTGSSGRRMVGTGPSELKARLAQFFASANMLAGTGSIPYNPDDIPEWIRRITLPTRISEKLGFSYGLAGRRNVLLARPESALVAPAPIILSGLAGLRQYGLAPPEEACANISLGNVLARTGQGWAGADPDDIATLIPDIYEDAKITAFYGSGTFAKGKRLLSLPLPDEAEIIWRAATAQRNTGGATIWADPEDLPDTIKDLRKSIITPIFGSAVDSRSHRHISTARPEEAGLAHCIATMTLRCGSVGVHISKPETSQQCLRFGCAGAITGRIIVGADREDLPPGRRACAHVGIMQVGLSAVG